MAIAGRIEYFGLLHTAPKTMLLLDNFMGAIDALLEDDGTNRIIVFDRFDKAIAALEVEYAR